MGLNSGIDSLVPLLYTLEKIRKVVEETPMGDRVCPFWVGYLLLNPLRKLLENPTKMLAPFVREGMIVLEPGCGMGYFTLPLARMVGARGKVIAVEVQAKMLAAVEKRARKANLLDRIEFRQTKSEGLGVEDCLGEVDLAVAIHMVHEVPEQTAFFEEIWKALKPGGKLLVIEPKGHVSRTQFEQTLKAAENTGFRQDPPPGKVGGRSGLLVKPLS
jgi:2-polyprenyl-3-methyl-5-hydroxy-6-metoxy-1,4-benzoquinol methylase